MGRHRIWTAVYRRYPVRSPFYVRWFFRLLMIVFAVATVWELLRGLVR